MKTRHSDPGNDATPGTRASRTPRGPIARRTFLGAIGAGFTAFVVRPACLRGAGRVLGEMSFVVVTDTHLGYKDEDKAAKLWTRTAAEIEAAPGAFVLHLGDVVDGGREEQYPVYLEARKVIKKPIHEIPGNHDPHEKFERHIRKPVDMVFDHEWLRVILLGNAHPDSHEGFLTAEQNAWIDARCEDAAKRDMFVLIAMHVPVHTNAHPDRGWFVKPASGQTEFYAVMKKHADRIVALFHGHFHNGLRGWDDHAAVHEVVFPSALYNQDRQLEAKGAAGYNPAEFRPGYTLVRIRDGAMELEYRVTGTDAKVAKILPVRRS
jgi:predicted phosphodiesterase